MKIEVLAAALAAVMATGVSAQDRTDSHNPAVKDSHARTTPMAASGRNSFTQRQAQTRIARAGYSRVSAPKKSQDGVWQGTAMKGGKQVRVGLDYRGDVSIH